MAHKLSYINESLQKCLPEEKSDSYSAYFYSGMRSIERNPNRGRIPVFDSLLSLDAPE